MTEGAYLYQAQRSADDAINFALSVISAWEGDLRRGAIDPDNPEVFSLSEVAQGACMFLQMSVNDEGGQGSPERSAFAFDQYLVIDQKGWIKRLIEALSGSYAAEEVLASILHICCFVLREPWYEAFDDYRLVPKLFYAHMSTFGQSLGKNFLA